MSTPVKLVGFLLALVVVFVAARGVGAATSPVAEPTEPMSHDGTDEGEPDDTHQAEEARAPGGLQVSDQGYTLRLLSAPDATRDRPLRFEVLGPDGYRVQVYDVVHARPLHLVVVNRDLSGYDHVHPELSDDGVWSIDLDPSPGTTRLIADFTPREGPALLLGTDLAVGGDYEPARPTRVSRQATVGDYDVSLTGDLVPGESSPVTLTVTRDGEPVTDLQPHLGAFGHLVVLREGDLAYLHV
ncbi:MAG: hypothetical protein ACXWDL_05925, partial [Nocardioides sp.]